MCFFPSLVVSVEQRSWSAQGAQSSSAVKATASNSFNVINTLSKEEFGKGDLIHNKNTIFLPGLGSRWEGGGKPTSHCCWLPTLTPLTFCQEVTKKVRTNAKPNLRRHVWHPALQFSEQVEIPAPWAAPSPAAPCLHDGAGPSMEPCSSIPPLCHVKSQLAPLGYTWEQMK